MVHDSQRATGSSDGAAQDAELRDLIDSCPVGIVLLDPGGRVLQRNPMGAQLLQELDPPITAVGESLCPLLSAHGIDLMALLQRSPERAVLIRWQRLQGRSTPGGPAMVASLWLARLGGPTLFAVLTDVSPLVARELEAEQITETMLALNKKLAARQQSLAQELELAAHLQRSLLPSPRRLPGGLDVSWWLHTGAELSGALFDVLPLVDRHAALVFLDGQGSGISAALLCALAMQTLQTRSQPLGAEHEPTLAALEPGAALALLGREFPAERSGRLLAAVYARLDLRSGALRYAMADGGALLLLPAAGAPRPCAAAGPALGLRDSGDPARFVTAEVALQRGDRLLFCSRGLLRAFAPKPADAQAELLRLFTAGRPTSVEEICAVVEQLVEGALGGKDPQGDAALLAVQYHGPLPAHEAPGAPDAPRGARGAR